MNSFKCCKQCEVRFFERRSSALRAKKWVLFPARPKRLYLQGCDVTRLQNVVKIMADKRPAKRGGRYCVAGGPNKTSCTNTSYTEGVSMHYFPSAEDARQKWTKFVRRHRKNFTPSKSSSLCSVHFEDSCFEQRPAVYSEDRVESIRFKRFLIKGSIFTRDTVVPYSSPESSRKRRKVSESIVVLFCCSLLVTLDFTLVGVS